MKPGMGELREKLGELHESDEGSYYSFPDRCSIVEKEDGKWVATWDDGSFMLDDDGKTPKFFDHIEDVLMCYWEAGEGPFASYRESNARPKPTEPIPELASNLTKREHFAAMALQGFATTVGKDFDCDFKFLSQMAVQMADVLIAELKKGSNE